MLQPPPLINLPGVAGKIVCSYWQVPLYHSQTVSAATKKVITDYSPNHFHWTSMSYYIISNYSIIFLYWHPKGDRYLYTTHIGFHFMWELLNTNIYIYIYMAVHTKCICNSHHANYTHYTVSEQYPFSASSINNLIFINLIYDI